MYGLEIVRGLLINSPKKYGLLIGSEQISKILNYEDRTTCVLFGDGAGAALIKLDDSLYVHLNASLLLDQMGYCCLKNSFTIHV